MIEGDWQAAKDQIKAEMSDKAPLIAHAYTELRREMAELGEEPSAMDLCLLATIWVNMTISALDERIKELQEAEEAE